jgi:hypothetical protein
MMRLLTLIVCLLATIDGTAFAAPLLFRNGRIFGGSKVAQGDVLVDKGLIRAVGRKLSAKGATVVDGVGKTLLPGFIDSHTHAYEDRARRIVRFVKKSAQANRPEKPTCGRREFSPRLRKATAPNTASPFDADQARRGGRVRCGSCEGWIRLPEDCAR